MSSTNLTVTDLLQGKSELTKALFHHFIDEYMTVGMITLHPAKTMIGIDNGSRRVAYITQLGRNFIHIVFPFSKLYPDNLCFTRIAQVPGDAHQFNHHFRMLQKEDINDEVKSFMRLAFNREQE